MINAPSESIRQRIESPLPLEVATAVAGVTGDE
jgi:hypothetical protein